MRKTQIRAFIAGVITLVVLVLFLAIASSKLGWDVPVLRNIAGAIGM
ncbi:MAG: hypothetical protein GY851_35140 [bacterium]|nr:hypothetical protein [bacterium]